MNNGQPIETVPDDQIVLVWGKYLAPTTAIKCTKGYYAGKFYAVADGQYPIYDSGEQGEAIIFGPYLPMPTHWMPLPAPPQESDT